MVFPPAQKWTLLAASVAVVVAQAYVEWKNSTGSAGAPRTAGMFFLFLALCLTLSFLMDCRDLVAESAQRAARERAFSARRSIK